MIPTQENSTIIEFRKLEYSFYILFREKTLRGVLFFIGCFLWLTENAMNYEFFLSRSWYAASFHKSIRVHGSVCRHEKWQSSISSHYIQVIKFFCRYSVFEDHQTSCIIKKFAWKLGQHFQFRNNNIIYLRKNLRVDNDYFFQSFCIFLAFLFIKSFISSVRTTNSTETIKYWERELAAGLN